MSNVIAPSRGESQGGAALVVAVSIWKYQDSVDRVRPLVLNWKNLTVELARELYIAREALNGRQGQRKDPDAADYINYTWNDFCEEIGISRRTANNWLSLFVPAEHSETGTDLLLDKRPSTRDAEWVASERDMREGRIGQFRATGVRPEGWTKDDELELRIRLSNERLRRLADEIHQMKSHSIKPRKDYLSEVIANTRGRKYKLSPDQQIMEADLHSAIKSYLMTFSDPTTRLKIAYNLSTVLRDTVNELTEYDLRAIEEEEAS